MKNVFGCLLIMTIGLSIGLTMFQTASAAINIDGTWKLNANGQKADLTIKGSLTGEITGTYHANCAGPGCRPYSSNIFGFWDDKAGKIVFLKENKAVFDNPADPGLSCNTGYDPTGKDKNPGVNEALICHGRDIAFTGYLFGENNPNNEITPTKPMMMAGVEQAFAGKSHAGGGVGANNVRNTFGWCATFKVDLCGIPLPTVSTSNATIMSNLTNSTK
jgi:hypothetical protein